MGKKNIWLHNGGYLAIRCVCGKKVKSHESLRICLTNFFLPHNKNFIRFLTMGVLLLKKDGNKVFLSGPCSVYKLYHEPMNSHCINQCDRQTIWREKKN